MSTSLIEHSKTLWVSENPNNELLMLGCAQRIAVTLEALNLSWCHVQSENASLRLRRMELERSNARLRGEIAKLRKRLAK